MRPSPTQLALEQALAENPHDLAAHHAHDSGPAAALASWVERLAEIDVETLDEEGALAVITALERVKRAACAAQARLSVRVDANCGWTVAQAEAQL